MPKKRYPFATMKIGETVTIQTTYRPRFFQHYVYMRAAKLNRRFSTLQVSPGVFEVRRIDGLTNEDELARDRSRSATLMWNRRRAK